MSKRLLVRVAVATVLVGGALHLPACRSPRGATDRRVAVVESFRAARKAGDLTTARTFLAEDPRLWYDALEGPGTPWKLEGGRWKAWDDHFRGVTRRDGAWSVDGDQVAADMLETNDYFALIERGPSWWRATYFFDGAGRIRGFMVSSAGRTPSAPGRRAEFEAWARAQHPGEAEHLMPGGSLDPTGDRPPRMRALLLTWRAALGLGNLPSASAEN